MKYGLFLCAYSDTYTDYYMNHNLSIISLLEYYRGDFRSGKRLNLRRIIPYIASNYQSDRIWLRRVKPSKREYQILVAVDDSSSMKENGCDQVSIQM